MNRNIGGNTIKDRDKPLCIRGNGTYVRKSLYNDILLSLKIEYWIYVKYLLELIG